jgi:malonyl-CoA decarboxylase
MPNTFDIPPFRPAIERVRQWWKRLAVMLRPAPGEAKLDRVRAKLIAQLKDLLEECRAQRWGELSARARAESISAIYRNADLDQRAAILGLFASAFAPDHATLDHALTAMQTATGDDGMRRAEAQLRLALGAPRAQFFAQFNLLPDGVKFLVDLRADLLELLPRDPSLEVLKVELDGLLTNWFDPGFLTLERITWQSPALLLEKLMAYEAVHPISSWADMRNRLDTDRRCYAFFHARMPNEPLIFVEIALLEGMPSSVQFLLDPAAPVQDPHTANTAIFYSISNAQSGLRGVSFGNLLLKRVIEDLRKDLPGLKTFATLSPLPGFRKWLDRTMDDDATALRPFESAKLAQAFGAEATGISLRNALTRPDWAAQAKVADALRQPMERLCARYLLQEKINGHPFDPVANFHLYNGARVNRLLWLADSSARGMQQSYGMMVSYRYDTDEVEANHERFSRSGHIAAASRVRRLVS